MTHPARLPIGRLAALCLATAALAACGPAPEDTADLALTGGRIYTVDAGRSWAEAVAIKDGRILYVGSDKGARAHIGKATRVVDLGGRMVVPGFQDAHVHPISAGVEANSCDLNAADTVEEYVELIRQYAAAHPDEPWITGGGWLMSAFGPGALARKELIDAVVPDRPVILWSRDGHTVWVNSKALEVAGITRKTPDPPDGRIDRDPRTGAAIGSLQEGAGDLVAAHMPPQSDERRDAGLRYAIKYLNGLGITAVQDASVNEDDLKTYRRLDDAGELSLHVVGSIWWEREQGLEQIPEIKRLRSEYTKGQVDAGTVKIMQDGVMENYTAAMLEPYLVPDRTRGIPMVEPERLKAAVTQLDADGFQVHFHAIGDAAIRQSLDAVEAARRANGGDGHRHHISHLQLIDAADVLIENFRPGVMERLGLGAKAATERNEHLVYCSLPGFASDDPRASLPAWEGVLGAATGVYLQGGEARFTASFAVSGQMMTNSSPPIRATVSPALTTPCRRLPTSASTRSPTAWPRVSLIALKPSRSRKQTARIRRRRRFWAMAWRSRSVSRVRFGSPVSGSKLASLSSLRWVALRSVMSA